MNYDNYWDEDKPELNITPLVDVMLVLLAILMVTTPTLTYKEENCFALLAQKLLEPLKIK